MGSVQVQPLTLSTHFATARPTMLSMSSALSSPVSEPQSRESAAAVAGDVATEPRVKCLVRTRIPTRYGVDCYVQLYENTLDNKQHMAIVFGQAIRSASLDGAVAGESALARLTRGALVEALSEVDTCEHSGKSAHKHHSSRPDPRDAVSTADASAAMPPLVRIHSECFTGETLGSVRCDCGDQLDAAMAQMAAAGSGVVLYLRQEGRGIGLAEKLRAYNLQDLGHDTVAANLLLQQPADGRRYDVAALMLRDLGLDRVRLLTNNPDKIEQLAAVGIPVVERVKMVPHHWARAAAAAVADDGSDSGNDEDVPAPVNGHDPFAVIAKATPVPRHLAAGHPPRAALHEMDNYLRTKAERMRHMIDFSERTIA